MLIGVQDMPCQRERGARELNRAGTWKTAPRHGRRPSRFRAPKRLPPKAIGKFQIHEQERFPCGPRMNLWRDASKEITQLNYEPKCVGPWSPRGLHKHGDAILVHLVQRPHQTCSWSIGFNRFHERLFATGCAQNSAAGSFCQHPSRRIEMLPLLVY